MDKAEAMRLLEHAAPEMTLEPEQHAAVYDAMVNEPSLRPGGVVLELGVCCGRTSILLAYIAKHKQMAYHGIDIFAICKEEEYRKAMDATGLPYTLHVGWTTSEKSPFAPDMPEVQWDTPINFLFIDASHTEPWFSADCKKYLPLVVPGCVVAFDDWRPEYAEYPEGAANAIPLHLAEAFTAGWEDLGWIDNRIRLKRKPIAG